MRQFVINLIFAIALVITTAIFLAVTGYVLDSMFDDARKALVLTSDRVGPIPRGR